MAISNNRNNILLTTFIIMVTIGHQQSKVVVLSLLTLYNIWKECMNMHRIMKSAVLCL